MNVQYFEGPAGTGKTTALLAELASRCQSGLEDQQRILALSFMHGARRRLDARVRRLPGMCGRFTCTTVDSFAKSLISRWRSLARSRFGSDPPDGDFEGVCHGAAKLLEDPLVRRWVAVRFPIVAVDEAQDCRGARLEILQRVAESVCLLAAADEFQDLSSEGVNEAVQWMRSVGVGVPLSVNYRTSVEGLLRAATSIRSGCGVVPARGLKIKSVPGVDVAATLLAYDLADRRTESTAILAGGAAQAKFTQKTLKKLSEQTIALRKVGIKVGPFRITSESALDDLAEREFAALALSAGDASRVDLAAVEYPATAVGRSLRNWARNRERLGGRPQVWVSEVRERVHRICHRIRAYGVQSEKAIRSMTIHQAKNREFDRVFVLWPYEVGGSEERRRRLLYNAVTRARRSCTILIQDPKQSRIHDSPFECE